MRLIDADELERMGYVLTRTYQQDKETMVYETKKLSDVPSAQPERKKGKWMLDTFQIRCNRCNKLFSDSLFPSKYCPNCGARME